MWKKIYTKINKNIWFTQFNLIETYAYGTSKDLVSENKDIECNSIIKQYKMVNFGDVTKGSIKEHKANWPQVPDHSCRILIIEGSGFGKAN